MEIIVNYLTELVIAAVSAVAIFYARKLSNTYDLKVNTDIVEDYIGDAARKVYGNLNSGKPITESSEELHEAVNHVLANAPKAMKKAGLNEDLVKEKILSYLK